MSETKTASFKSAAHLKSYPVVADIITFLSSFPLLVAILSNIKPFLLYLQHLVLRVSPLHSVALSADSFVDRKFLTSLDNAVPAVKTLRLDDVNKENIRIYGKNVAGKVLQSKLITKASEIRPKVTGKVDPLVKPLNDRIENLINSYLPEGTKPNEASVDEISRVYHLVGQAYNRTLPVASTEISDISSKFRETYISNLPENAAAAAPSERFAAVARASVQLSSKGIDYIKPKVSPYVSKINLGNVKVSFSNAADNAKNDIDALSTEAIEGARAPSANGSST